MAVHIAYKETIIVSSRSFHNVVGLLNDKIKKVKDGLKKEHLEEYKLDDTSPFMSTIVSMTSVQDNTGECFLIAHVLFEKDGW